MNSRAILSCCRSIYCLLILKAFLFHIIFFYIILLSGNRLQTSGLQHWEREAHTKNKNKKIKKDETVCFVANYEAFIFSWNNLEAYSWIYNNGLSKNKLIGYEPIRLAFRESLRFGYYANKFTNKSMKFFLNEYFLLII